MTCSLRNVLLLICGIVMVPADSIANQDGGKNLVIFVTAFAPGNDGAIHACQLDLTNGQLTPVHRTTGIEHPFFMALSPDRKFLYAIHAPGTFGGSENEFVSAWKVEGRTGRLQPLNQQSAHGTAACYLDVDASGKTVFVANYLTGSVASLPVQNDGSLAPAVSFLQHQGSSVNPARQAGPHAHCIVVSPDNRHVYAADLGLDQIVAYRLEAETGKLLPAEQPFVRTPPGAGPRHLTFHPSGQHVYVINELTNSVTLFGYRSESGILIEQQTISTLPADFDGTSYCADLKITPNGEFLYGTNRGHDSIAAYRLDESGRMSLIGIQPSLGKGPQNLVISPDGKWLLCANMPGNNVVVFQINTDDGTLNPVGTPLEIISPSCLRIY